MYSINYHEEVEKDFKELGRATTLLVLKKIQKIAQNPIIGDDLGNKANINLSGYKKVYVDNKKVRIVYKIIDDKIEIFVVAIGKRDEMEVYQKAFKRIQEQSKHP
ncbi:MAG: type II toxin-antitoxin system RelE/ParE family toxin [Campylobacterales bacterium]|nr:type II toxin-antitoxin system RelE/ParE family toxin [Campylobacterales bacterium]